MKFPLEEVSRFSQSIDEVIVEKAETLTDSIFTSAEIGESDELSPEQWFELGYKMMQKFNFAGAAIMFRIAFRNGHLKACIPLSNLYTGGLGTDKNPEKANALLLEAATSGCWEAQDELALACLSNEDNPRWEERQLWLRKSLVGCRMAAERGDMDAMLALGLKYESGYGVAADIDEAIIWFKKAAELGDGIAQAHLSEIYSDGVKVHCDFEEAAKWQLLSAQGGNSESQANYALACRIGRGVPQNDQLAFEWFSKSSSDGNHHANFHLAHMMEHGLGTQKDTAKALEYLKLAAEQMREACVELSRMFRHGIGCVKDLHEANKWLELSKASDEVWYKRKNDSLLASLSASKRSLGS